MKYTYKKFFGSTFFSISIILFLLVLVIGCVSQKKYDAALQEIARLSVDSTFQEYKLTNTEFEKDGLLYKQEEALDLKSLKLDSLKLVVRDLRRNLKKSEDLMKSLQELETSDSQ
ncbi:hypothetical protein [Ekhidna sp.]